MMRGLFVAVALVAASSCGGSRPVESGRTVVAAGATELDIDWPSPPVRTERDDPTLGHTSTAVADSGGVRFMLFRTGRSLGCAPAACLDDVRVSLVMTEIGSSMTAGEERAVLGDPGTAASQGFTIISPRGTLLADAYVLSDAVVHAMVLLPPGTTSDPAAEGFLRSARVR